MSVESSCYLGLRAYCLQGNHHPKMGDSLPLKRVELIYVIFANLAFVKSVKQATTRRRAASI